MSFRKMETNRVGPLVDRAYREGGKFQWVRETCINAIEAGATQISFGVEPQGVANKLVYRRTIADNGKGMTPKELEDFFNIFGGGGKPIGDAHENFGIGAKTSLLPWNRCGVVVLSWVENSQELSMIRLKYDEETGEYGLHVMEVMDEDGFVSNEAVYSPYYDDELGIDWEQAKPEWIGSHGTLIVLLGNNPLDDTVLGDPGHPEEAIRALPSYLNHRLWEIPDIRIEVTEFTAKSKDKWPRDLLKRGSFEAGHIVRSINGAKHSIAVPSTFPKFELKTGTICVPKFQTEIDWYLWCGNATELRTARDAHNYLPRRGFVSVLYRNELYNRQDHHETYRSFGISETSVRNNLWIVIRPPELNNSGGVYPRADRNSLLWRGGEDLPFHEWAETFANELPSPIVEALRSARKEAPTTIDNEHWKQNLAHRFSSLWRVPRYKIDSRGPENAGDSHIPSISMLPQSQEPYKQPRKQRPAMPRPARPIDSNEFLGPGDDHSAQKTSLRLGLPDCEFTDEPEDIESNLLACFMARSKAQPNGLIKIYRGHPMFVHIVESYQREYPLHYADQVRDIVEGVYRDIIVAKVAHSEQMHQFVDRKIVDEMRSPRSLTIAVLGLVSEDALIRQRLKSSGPRRRKDTEEA